MALTFKKRKFKFVFPKKEPVLKLKPKDFLGGGSPSEKRYEELIEEYGDEPEYVTNFGVKIFPTGEQFVIDGKTGRVIVRDKTTRNRGMEIESGLYVHLGEGSELLEGDEAYPSFVKDKQPR